MSDKRNQEEETLNSDQALNILKENCQNYLEMNSQERSEGITINYLLGLIKLSGNLKIEDESFIMTLFDDILFKDLNILKNRNLFSNFIFEFEKRKNQELFQKKLFSVLVEFGSEYNSNSIYFHQYLIDISLNYIFASSFVCEEKTKYIEMIIDNDIKPFETQLFKRIINKSEKLIDNNKNKLYMLKCLFNKFIDMNKYKSCLILFMKLLENVNGQYKNIPKDIIFEIIKTTNEKGFNHVIKKTKEINDFLIFNCLILGNLDEKLFISEVDIEIFDSYLVNLLNLLALKKDLNIDIFNKIFSFYVQNKYNNLNKVFFDILYYLSSFSYSSNQIEFIFHCIKATPSNIIYNKIITNHLLFLNKIPAKLNEQKINNQKNEKFMIVKEISNKDCDSIEHCLFSFNNNINNVSFLNHLNLFNYIINSSFVIKKSSDNISVIYFYPIFLNKILVLLNNLSLEIHNKKLFEEMLIFLFNFISVLFNLYFSDNNLVFNEEYLLIAFLKIIEKASTDNKYLIVFPSFINIIKTIINNEYDNNKIFNNYKIYSFIYDYMISHSYNDSSGLINYQQNILLFKSLIILFTNKNNTNFKKKIFLLNKLIDLTIKSNNKKVQFSFIKFCEELIKNSIEENINLGLYSLNKYSKLINNYNNESFIDYIMDKFRETFMQKMPKNIEFNDNTYFIINTISNIYNNSCIKYKNYSNEKLLTFIELIDEFCENKMITGVCDYLFLSIETNDCDMMNMIKNEKNIFLKYEKINKAFNNLDYFSYKYDNYFDNNIQNNKISLCHYGILKSLAYLLSGYLSNSIYNLLNIENKSDIKNKKEEIVMNLFNYIKSKILFNETLKNTSYPVYFLNCIFSNKYILHYYIVYYIHYSILKENQQNNSYMQEMIKNNKAIIDYIRQNQYFILFMKDIINSFIEFDTNFLIGNKNALMKGKTINIKINENANRINEIKRKSENELQGYNENQKSMINSFFTKMFLDEISQKNYPTKSFENNQIIFLFLLDTSLLDKYFSSFGYFINIDYTFIQLYSILRNKNLSIALNEKVINFIKKYNNLDNLRFFIMGMVNNEKIFNSFFKQKNISESYNNNLYDIIKYVINKLFLNLKENENIIQKFLNVFIKIIDYINNLYKISKNSAYLELYLLGKIILEFKEKLNKYQLESQIEANNIENNEKENKNKIQVDKILSTFNSSVLPNYIKSVYSVLTKCLDNENQAIDNRLDNAFHSFFIVLDLLSIENINEILSSKVENEILNFFEKFQCFNENNQYLYVDLKYFKLFFEKYIELRNDSSKKIFLEYLYLFSLFKGKHDEKNLKSVAVEFFGEYQDKGIKEDFKKYGFITCYFLSSNKKDLNNSYKNINSIKFNSIDFLIIKNIGERFKDDEKSLKKTI